MDELLADQAWMARAFQYYNNAEIDEIMGDVAKEAVAEMREACKKWPKFNSAHEGYAVLKEEVDELWAHVKINQKKRDISAMRREATQVAAMALRFCIDICNEEDGRK